MTREPIVRLPGRGRTIAVVGDVYRFLATGEETNAAAPRYGIEILPPKHDS